MAHWQTSWLDFEWCETHLWIFCRLSGRTAAQQDGDYLFLPEIDHDVQMQLIWGIVRGIWLSAFITVAVGFLFFCTSCREAVCYQMADHMEYAGHALSGIAAHLMPMAPPCDPNTLKRSILFQSALCFCPSLRNSCESKYGSRLVFQSTAPENI